MRFEDTKPFYRTKLEEEKTEKGEVLSLRMNPAELRELEKDKELLNIGPDGAMIKLLVREGRKVIRKALTRETLTYLVSRKRTEYEPKESRK